uniref:Uncharacterized protein n=1 Tax=Apteryx owenii TaxID=8824 RepID=A0A8B9PAV9_APTOW
MKNLFPQRAEKELSPCTGASFSLQPNHKVALPSRYFLIIHKQEREKQDTFSCKLPCLSLLCFLLWHCIGHALMQQWLITLVPEGVLLRADCSDRGLTAVPANLSGFTAYLMNNITKLPSNSMHNLRFLEELRLDANHINYVPPNCFSGLVSLRHLWLDDNSLTEIPVQAFRSLPALQAMTLALNKIHHIPDYAFGNLSSLVVL